MLDFCKTKAFKEIYGNRTAEELYELSDECFDKFTYDTEMKQERKLAETIKLNDKNKLKDFLNQYLFVYYWGDKMTQLKLLRLIRGNRIKKVQEILKDYPLDLRFYYNCLIDTIEDPLIPFFNPVSALACAGNAYDKSKSFEMLEFLQEYGLKIDYIDFMYHNSLTCYLY